MSNPTHTVFSYRATASTAINGFTAIKLYRLTPTTLKIKAVGKAGNYGTPTPALKVSIILDGAVPAESDCSEVTFTADRCRSSIGSLRCK